MSRHFAHVIAAVATPFRRDLGIDLSALASHCASLLSSGCDGLVLFGTTGEAASLSVPERKVALEYLVQQGIDAKRLLVGTGCPSMIDVIELNRHASECGVAGVLIMPPYFFRDADDEGIFRWYEAVIDQSDGRDLGVYLYNFPKMSGTEISVSMTERLSHRFPGQIHGYKDSSGDWKNTEAIISACPDLQVFVGSEAQLLQNLNSGGAGCISATANLWPGLIQSLYAARSEVGAVEMQEAVSALRKEIQKRPMIAAVKSILAWRKGDTSWLRLRPPLTGLKAQETNHLKSRLADIVSQCDGDSQLKIRRELPLP